MKTSTSHRVVTLRAAIAASLLLAGLAVPVRPVLAGAARPDAPAAQSTPKATAPAFPAAWLGHWKGSITQTAPGGRTMSFSMELKIAKTDDPNTFQWIIIYEGAQGRQERPYMLIVKDAAKGQFAIDEKNGIIIPSQHLDGVVYTQFSVQGNRIWTREELVGAGMPDERIAVEIGTIDDSAVTKSGGGEVPEVSSWTPLSVQRGELRRVNTEGSAKPAASAPASTSTLAAGEQPKPGVSLASLEASPRSWTKQTTEAYSGKQDDIYFINPQTGWYGNGAGKIFKTTDGGKTWTQKLHKPGTFFRCIAFLDDQIGFAGNIGPGYFPNVSDKEPLYRTTDGGETWTAVTTIEGQPVVGLCAMEIVKIPFVNAGNLDYKRRVVAVGRVGGPTAFIYSDDQGATWKQIKLPESCAMAFDVHFFDDKHGVIASATSADVQESRALILTTDDGGQTWREAYTSARPFELTWKISFPTREVGYVTIQSYNPDPAASQRFIAKTTDGGKTWSEVPLVNEAKVRQFGVAFVDANRGWVGAMPSGFETIDGGKTWLKTNFGNAVNKIRVIEDGDQWRLFAIGVNVSTLAVPKGSQ